MVQCELSEEFSNFQVIFIKMDKQFKNCASDKEINKIKCVEKRLSSHWLLSLFYDGLEFFLLWHFCNIFQTIDVGFLGQFQK